MKKLSLILPFVLIIGLFACDVKEDLTLECVSDEISEVPSSYLVMSLPENVFLTESALDGRLGLFSHRDYEIIQEVFAAESTDAAIQHISGRALDPFVLPDGRIRFSWASAQENGMITCSALLLTDGDYYYSVCIRCPAELERNYREVFSEIMASVALESV